MRQRTWLPKKPWPPARPKVLDEVREAVDAQAAITVAALKKRFRQKSHNPRFNWPDDLFTRWHRDALYFVVVMRTASGRPATFETHVARMEHVGHGKFNLAVPMRRGWNTVQRDATPEQCLRVICELVWL